MPVPAIVDEALFASAAEQLEENRRRSRERLAGVRYLLRGLLVCRKCGYGFTGHHHRGRWRYYRCCGTDRSRFHGQFRCDARLIAVEPLDTAVWGEVCRLLKDPARVLEEYQRRLDAVQADPRRLELDVLERQIAKARSAIGRLIDGYAEGLIEKAEFEPRIAELRSRAARLEAEAGALRAAEEQARSLQLVISKLGLFATTVRDRLETADWPTMRDIICTLVRRIEVADDAVRVVFRVDPGSSGPPQPLRRLPYCPTRRRAAADLDQRGRVPLRPRGCRGVIGLGRVEIGKRGDRDRAGPQGCPGEVPSPGREADDAVASLVACLPSRTTLTQIGASTSPEGMMQRPRVPTADGSMRPATRCRAAGWGRRPWHGSHDRAFWNAAASLRNPDQLRAAAARVTRAPGG